MPPLEFGFGLEPIFHFVAGLKAAIEGSKVGEFGNQSVARSHRRRCDEPQWIERRRAGVSVDPATDAMLRNFFATRARQIYSDVHYDLYELERSGQGASAGTKAP